MTVSLTHKKVRNIVTTCVQFLQSQQTTIRELASLIGTLVSTFPGVEFGPLYYRALERNKDFALKTSKGDFDAELCLSPASIHELNWWVSSLPTASRTIDHGIPHVVLSTDASHTGWGAAVGTHRT